MAKHRTFKPEFKARVVLQVLTGLKKHGYPPKSIFRRGLDILCRLVTNFERFDVAVWRNVIKLLSCS